MTILGPHMGMCHFPVCLSAQYVILMTRVATITVGDKNVPTVPAPWL